MLRHPRKNTGIAGRELPRYGCHRPPCSSLVGREIGDTRSLDYSSCNLQSKLLKGGYIGDYIGDYYRGY